MLKVGIDAISFYTSRFYLDLGVLANARNIDPDKYYIGLGQQQMGIAPPDEDIVTMATHAAERVLEKVDISSIDTLLFATESGIDHSKSAGIYVHELLGLPKNCRTLEIKQACYSCTGAMQLVLPRLQLHPDKKILLIASDISRYGFDTPGESSQGCGAVAMILSANPRILAIDPESSSYTEDVMDFWRPTYKEEAIVDGKYSSRLYLNMLEKTWAGYAKESNRHFKDHYRFCYHNSVPRLVEKAHKALAKYSGHSNIENNVLMEQVKDSLAYPRLTGNSYSASLYIGLASLFDNCQDDLSEKRIGFYSYGSGCVAEFFSGVVQPGYQKHLDTDYHKKMLSSRNELTYDQYKAFYSYKLPEDGSNVVIPKRIENKFRFSELNKHKRIYQKD